MDRSPRTAPQTRLVRTLRGHPSGVLLTGQLLAVLLYPFTGSSIPGRAALGAMSTVLVLVALYAVRRTPALAWVALVLGAPAVLFNVLEVVWPESDVVLLGSALLHAPFYFYVSYGMIRYLFHDKKVTRDELFATGAAFTVVAWGFAYLHLAVQVLWPDSYGPVDRSFFELLYLSFTTLTSVGLSDIVPVTPHARSIVIVEQVAGVMYVALVVARMVGLTVIKPELEDEQ
ncbi:potassium channel family protein [Nocardioides sp.]|uniref:potassium channel family protein n=1 Tax=Nocardioides sp. TaxID=35761 RepID=UPI002ED51067